MLYTKQKISYIKITQSFFVDSLYFKLMNSEIPDDVLVTSIVDMFDSVIRSRTQELLSVSTSKFNSLGRGAYIFSISYPVTLHSIKYKYLTLDSIKNVHCVNMVKQYIPENEFVYLVNFNSKGKSTMVYMTIVKSIWKSTIPSEIELPIVSVLNGFIENLEKNSIRLNIDNKVICRKVDVIDIDDGEYKKKKLDISQDKMETNEKVYVKSERKSESSLTRKKIKLIDPHKLMDQRQVISPYDE